MSLKDFIFITNFWSGIWHYILPHAIATHGYLHDDRNRTLGVSSINPRTVHVHQPLCTHNPPPCWRRFLALVPHCQWPLRHCLTLHAYTLLSLRSNFSFQVLCTRVFNSLWKVGIKINTEWLSSQKIKDKTK
jgi:hypothetical protein